MRRARWICGLVVATGCAATGAHATYDVTHHIEFPIPKGSKSVRVWMVRPQSDATQNVRRFDVDASAGSHRTATDSEGNRYLYWDLKDPPMTEFRVTNTFEITRKEVRATIDPAGTRPIRDAERKEHARYLQANEHVVIDARIREMAAQVVGDETNPIRAARRIYDWVLDNIEYWVKDPAHLKASKVGSSQYCLRTKTGNCTDFHSLYMALSRAAGIPTRIVYGSLFKQPLDGQDKDQSYHCWIEFWAPQVGWIPLDVAVADIFVDGVDVNDTNRPKMALTTATGYQGPDKKMVDYYFGNLDDRRVAWTRGRDLMLDPRQKGGPVNAIPKAYIEIDGKAVPAFSRKLTYREVK